jgi:hypothetical protein
MQELESIIATQPSIREQLEELLDDLTARVEDLLQRLEPIEQRFRTMATTQLKL